MDEQKATERKARRNEQMRRYMREYRRRNPEKALQWRLNAAQRLLARAAADRGGDGGC